MQIQKQNSKAFSLIELIVSVSILILLSTIVAVQLTSYKKEDALDFSIEKLKSTIEFTQNLALSGVKYDDAAPVNSYGLVIKPDGSYFVFANAKDDEELYYEAGSDYELEQRSFSLEKGINFNTGDKILNIVYALPFAKVSFYEDTVSVDSLTFTAQTEDDSLIKTVTVEQSGNLTVTD